MDQKAPADFRSLAKGVRGFALFITLLFCGFNLLVASHIGHLEDLIDDNFRVLGAPQTIFSGLQNYLVAIALAIPFAATSVAIFMRSNRGALYALCGLILVALFEVYLVWAAMLAPLTAPIAFRHTVLKGLLSSTEVRVVEHSDPHDTPGPTPAGYAEKIYATSVLDRKQLNDLYLALPFAFGYSYQTQCGLVPHHRIEFVQPDGTISTMELCFKCGELQLNDQSQRGFPPGWYQTLKQFISSLGMHPDGPWTDR